MKKIIILIIILISFTLLLGCTNPKEVALANPKIKDFLDEYDNAKLVLFEEYSAYDFIDNKEFWKDCEEKIPAEDYYYAIFEDEKIRLDALFDKSRIKLVCGILDDKFAKGNEQNKEEETQIETGPVDCTTIDCFISAAKECKKEFFTSEFGTRFEIIGKENEYCKIYRIDTNDFCYYKNNELVDMLNRWKKGNYLTEDFKNCGEKFLEEEICVENWICSDFGECLDTNNQIRTCNELNNCGTDINKPNEIQTCVYTPPCEEIWACSEWSACENGKQTRQCFLVNDCGYDSSEEIIRDC